MKVGDLVKRKVPVAVNVGVGIIVGKHIAGDPPHKCVDVFYPRVGKTWSIGESLVEVVSESR